MNVTLRLAWRNLWRHSRRTWLTVGAMIFTNVLIIFLISLQLGSYDMMIENTLRPLSGHLQVQREGYLEEPRNRFAGEIGLLALPRNVQDVAALVRRIIMARSTWLAA